MYERKKYCDSYIIYHLCIFIYKKSYLCKYYKYNIINII